MYIFYCWYFPPTPFLLLLLFFTFHYTPCSLTCWMSLTMRSTVISGSLLFRFWSSFFSIVRGGGESKTKEISMKNIGVKVLNNLKLKQKYKPVGFIRELGESY